MERALRVVVLLFLVSVGRGAPARAQDHPLFRPYPGSEAESREVTEHGQIDLPVGPVAPRGAFKSQPLEGKLTVIHYQNPDGRSADEIFRHYQSALAGRGFQLLFSCRERECGRPTRIQHLGYFPTNATRYLIAHLVRLEGDVYLAAHVSDIVTYLTVVETRPPAGILTKATAAGLAATLARDGHVAVYGIAFEDREAGIRPESFPIIREIAAVLKGNGSLRLLVVSHTDSVGGGISENVELARRQAAAVVRELVTRHGVGAARLRSEGAGPLAPVATNRTEQGRARNRRIELVEQEP